MVLVCTDRASRGVDTSHVQHVVLFDFPRDPSEYVRRVGRTARGAGGQGVVSVLVLGRQARTHTLLCIPGLVFAVTHSLSVYVRWYVLNLARSSQVQLAKDVMDRSQRGTPIHRVPQPFLNTPSY